MEIKEITFKDWNELRNLYLKLLKNDPDAFADNYEDVEMRTEDDWIRDLERSGKTFVAIEAKKYVGMGRINFYESIPNIPVLHKLGVLPEYRGKGIAHALIDVREKYAVSQSAQKVRLYVMADKMRTIEFSKKNGYSITETLKGDVQRKDGTWSDVVVMEKKLLN
jgi:ribosomal protein S18 acetylase RimI-like enzyme